jgi:hypothetical protein
VPRLETFNLLTQGVFIRDTDRCQGENRLISKARNHTAPRKITGLAALVDEIVHSAMLDAVPMVLRQENPRVETLFMNPAHLSLGMTLLELETLFQSVGIDYENPGFYDSPPFLAAEQRDPSFLDRYSEYVERRIYEPAYIHRIRNLVPRLAAFVYRHLQEEGRLGACIDVSGMFSRMLDLEGVWAYAVGGRVTVNFPAHSEVQPSHFGVIGGESNVAAHMWVKAPPFVVIDISLPEQRWGQAHQRFFVDLCHNGNELAPRSNSGATGRYERIRRVCSREWSKTYDERCRKAYTARISIHGTLSVVLGCFGRSYRGLRSNEGWGQPRTARRNDSPSPQPAFAH